MWGKGTERSVRSKLYTKHGILLPDVLTNFKPQLNNFLLWADVRKRLKFFQANTLHKSKDSHTLEICLHIGVWAKGRIGSDKKEDVSRDRVVNGLQDKDK